jgi:hypothetical protein
MGGPPIERVACGHLYHFGHSTSSFSNALFTEKLKDEFFAQSNSGGFGEMEKNRDRENREN